MSFVITLTFLVAVVALRKDEIARPTLLLLAGITLIMAVVSVCTLLHYHNAVISGASFGAVIGILPFLGSIAAVAKWRLLRVGLFGSSVLAACAAAFLVSSVLQWPANVATVGTWVLTLPLGIWQYRRIRHSELDEITEEFP